MKTYVFTSMSNYGILTVIINAPNKASAVETAKDHPHVWDNYSCEQLDTHSAGVVYNSGEE